MGKCFEKFLKSIGKFQKISRKISEYFEKYFRHFRVFRKIFRTKSFRKISKIILENFWKLIEIYLEVTRNIIELLRIILKNFKKVSKNFDNYCGEFWEFFITFVIRFRRPWLRVKSVNFDFNAKSSSTEYNESNKPIPKSLAHKGSEKSLLQLGVPKNELFLFFTFFALLKSLLFHLKL